MPSRAIGLVVEFVALFGSALIKLAGQIAREPGTQLPSPAPRRKRVIAAVIAVLAFSWTIHGQAQDAPPPIPAGEQPQVLTRGPVHEAFAEPVALQTEAALVVPKQPPANIDEVPPADRPQGDHFVWVPGYWSWDADRSGFIWVSACWRVGPPNTYWMPGYWAAVEGGWEWVAGFWAPVGSGEIEYLPAPPAPVDITPPGAPPAADNTWVPGCWYYRDDQYVRRPGYWLRQQADWVWEPAHYRWTARGYVFEAGHWDYSLDRRGVLFAPVYLPPSLYARAGYSYSPTIALDLGVLSANLFTYPRYNHYYFGDYYDDAYVRIGIYPRFESDRLHTWYDPIYSYDRWHYGRADNRWEEHQREEYDHRRSDVNLRPARTYREMETRVARMPEAQRRNVELARPLQVIVTNKTNSVKFEQINIDTRQKIGKQANDTHKFREERVKWEATGATHPKAVRPPVDTKMAPPVAHRDPVAAPAAHRDPVTPPVVHRDPVIPPAAHKDPVLPPAAHRDPVLPPAAHKDPVLAPAAHTPALVPPREVPLTKPERVKIPVPPPIVARPGTTGDVGKGPPARPADEQKHSVRDAPKTDVRDAPKGRDPVDRKEK